MKPLEQIMAWHDIEYISSYGWIDYATDVLALRLSLNSEHETTLQTRVQALINYTEVKDLPGGHSDRLYLEMACLVSERDRVVKTPIDIFTTNDDKLSEYQIKTALGFVEMCEEIIDEYRDFSSERKQRIRKLLGFANKSEIPTLLSDLQNMKDYEGIRGGTELQIVLFDLYYQLNTSNIDYLLRHALALRETGRRSNQDIARQILRYATNLHPRSTVVIHNELLKGHRYFPPNLFFDASEHIAKQLRELIKPDNGGFYFALMALMWTRSQTAQAFMLENHDWLEERLPSYLWSHDAGWELTSDETRYDLYYETCYPLINGDESATTRVLTQRTDTCAWCDQPLDNVFDLDLTDPRLAFLGITGTRLRIPTCMTCVGWNTIIFKVDFEGNATWSNHSGDQSEYTRVDPYEALPNTLTLAEEPRKSPFESQVMDHGNSQIGGHPFWVNDAFYPKCPDCFQSMKVIGQLQMSDVIPMDGWIYVYLCVDCQYAATYFDQS